MRGRTKNEAENPITDPYEALILLKPGFWRTSAALLTGRRAGPAATPVIVQEHGGGAYDMEVVGRDTWHVSPTVVAWLEEHGCLDSGRKHWGYTDRHERQISDQGRQVLFDRAKLIADRMQDVVTLVT